MRKEWQDIEDYALGQQGVATGSAYNQVGLMDSNHLGSSIGSSNRRQAKHTKINRKNAETSTRKVSSSEYKRRRFFMYIGALITCVVFYNKGVEAPLAYFFGGMAGGYVLAATYKAVISISLGVFFLWMGLQLNLL